MVKSYYNLGELNYNRTAFTMVQEFHDTLNTAGNVFKKETQELLDGTRVYEDPCTLEPKNPLQNNYEVVFTMDGTVNTAHALAGTYKRVALLNFADALIPGGFVLDGPGTQEENICRCTNLYNSLTSRGMRYYYLNRMDRDSKPDEYRYLETYRGIDYSYGKYLDALIYSPDTLILKDDTNYYYVEPRQVDVITCPTPAVRLNPQEFEEIMERRIEGVLRSAASYGVEAIVLGAWGCGAFGQDPEVVAHCFAKVLNKLPAFKNVTFAIKSPRIYGNPNYYKMLRVIDNEIQNARVISHEG